jgi:3-isopropylmalate dehydratase small subunit
VSHHWQALESTRLTDNKQGSLANLGSAATVAASSFSMTISDPRPLLEAIDPAYLLDCLDYQPLVKEGPETEAKQQSISYSEPYCIDSEKQEQVASQSPPDPEDKTMEDGGDAPIAAGDGRDRIDGRVLPLGDFIDTDAVSPLSPHKSTKSLRLTSASGFQIIPSKFLAGNTTNESLGAHCMEFFMPEFRQLVRDGLDIVVGGEGFGCGSSRDVAVNALLGAGVRCVIAKSFAFIYARNQPNIGLLGITIADDDFYRLATRGADISIDLTSSQVYCGGKAFAFQLSAMEKSLIAAGGLTEAFKKFGTHVFDALCQHPQQKVARRPQKKADDIESIGLRKDDWSL